MITTYNGGETYQMKNLNLMYQFEISMFGFIMTTLMPKYPEFYTEFPKRVASGEIKYNEDTYTGLKNAGIALEAIQRGTNTGKVIVTVAQ